MRDRETLRTEAMSEGTADGVYGWLEQHPLLVQEGAAEGVYAWLEQHPVTVQEPLIEAIGAAVTRWLDANGDEIIEAVAARGAHSAMDARLGGNGADSR